MTRKINRRDLLHGVGAVAAASFVPGSAFANQMLAEEAAGYPPQLTGLRGSHVGSYEIAHQLAREGRTDWGTVTEPDSEEYDLIVVGGGISGLAAAHFYRQANGGARILVLDNHDDFGGHAKRNEFSIADKTLLGYGGSQTMESPHEYRKVVKTLLRDLGVDLSRFDTAYDAGFFKRHDLGAGIYFDEESWGKQKTVRHELGATFDYLPLAKSDISAAEAVAEMPMSDAARQELARFLSNRTDQIAHIPLAKKEDFLYSISYREFLEQYGGITEPEVFALFQRLTADTSVGIEATAAADALGYSGLPGLAAAGIPETDDVDPYIHHFPDGNASIARLLVRKMIPAVAPESTAEDVVRARFDYSKLDCAKEKVRVRLNSTVVNVAHKGLARTAKSVAVTYVNGGKACRVNAKHVVMACYNAIVPAICPELPEQQKKALSNQVKSPILYTSVALSNWRAWKHLGLGAVASPTAYHVMTMLDFPVSMGGYDFAKNPDEPIVVHMERFPHRANQGLSVQDQLRLGRHELYATSFETIERSVRKQLAGILSGSDFDPARDIEAITVNRWAHGYAYGYYDMDDIYYDDWNDRRYPHVIGRQPCGRIAIANSDSGASAMLQSAVEQAHRAVSELI